MDYGLIGKNLTHSYAKEFHEAISDIDYEIKSFDEKAFDSFIKSRKFKGLNITIPYKERVMPMLDELSDHAREIGAVNLVINKNGKLYGDNVDYYGLMVSIRHARIRIKGKHVLILGTGGTSRTAEYCCKILGAKSIVKASIEGHYHKGEVSYRKAKTLSETEIIINTTPVGMFPHVDDDMLVDLDNYPNLQGVVDCIYNPFKTRLLIEAKARNIPYCNGLMMLVAQGILTNQAFTGRKYDKRVYLQTYLSIICNDTNIVLIGMPGSGKNTLANELSDILGILSIDMDTQIEKKKKVKVFDLLLKKDDKQFRDLESNMIKEIARRSGNVISTGGGIVLRERNIKTLERNSIIVYIDRDIESIRSTLTSENWKQLIEKFGSLEKMHSHRDAMYRKHADLIVKNDSSIHEVAMRIVDGIVGEHFGDIDE